MLLARALVDGAPVYAEVEGERLRLLAGDPFERPRPTEHSVPLANARLVSPTDPRTVLVMMGGFKPKDGSPLPPGTVPWLLPKVATRVSGDGGEVVWPKGVTKLWAEVELAIVIGRTIHQGSRDDAREAILGFTVFNDASAPEYLPTHDYFRTKGLDTFSSMGPWVRTDLTEDDLARGLRIAVRVNGTEQGDGNTKDLKFPVSEVVQFAAQYATLQPGDVIALGTPKPVEVRPGDQVELEVEGIGVLHNRISEAPD